MGWMENIAGEEWFCSKCGRGFANKSVAENHERSCQGVKRCRFCGKKYNASYDGCPYCRRA